MLCSADEIASPTGFGGLGIQIALEDGRVVILGVLPNTPAEQAELVPGSTITAIDGEPAAGKSVDQIVGKLRGEVGTSVRLTILSPDAIGGGFVTREIELNRGFIPFPSAIPAIVPVKKPIDSIPIRGSVTYYITTIPKPGQISVTTPVLVRLMLNNPKGSSADIIAMQVNFDPQVFSCADAELDINTGLISGWTQATAGIDTTSGKIYLEYRTALPTLVKSGCLAEIRLNPKRAVTETAITYSFNPVWGQEPNTVFTCRGKDLLGSEFDHQDGTMGVRIRIDKEPVNR
ncbi:MAG: PDZ domain-containing protein [bacterium]|nr:PDZ domain-containing protein [bacterium]